MIASVGVDLPQREPRSVERRMRLERRIQIIDRGGRGFGEQPLDVVLERPDGRVVERGPGYWRHAARRRDLTAEALEQGEELRERAALGRVRLNPARFDRN